nr:protein NAR1 [Tanacetum cinerariifolium]
MDDDDDLEDASSSTTSKQFSNVWEYFERIPVVGPDGTKRATCTQCKKVLLPGDIYHVTVMPCYDKKLEASRDDFVLRDQSDDDDQMTTESKAVDFSNLDEAPLDKLLSNVSEEGHLFGVRGSSGGYADTVFRYAAKTLFDQDIKGPLEFRTLRNSDFKEVTLEVEGKTELKFALCYGFRNLQNVARKIKEGKSDYHYLEIMACPSGCLNGGGQLKPKPGQSGKDLVQALETTYMENVLVADPFENPIVKSLYSEWLGHPGTGKGEKQRELILWASLSALLAVLSLLASVLSISA